MRACSRVSRCWARWTAIAVLSIVCAGLTQAQTSSTETADVRNLTGAFSPLRVTVSQSAQNGRTVETRVTEAPSINGGYAPVSTIERERIQESGNTVRVVQRSFVLDPQGNRRLFQTTEAVTTTLPDGREKTTRTTSNADLNGSVQPVQREVEESTPIDAVTNRTTTSVFLPGSNGFAIAQQTEQLEQRQEGRVIEVQRTDKIPDPNGNMVATKAQQVETKTADGVETTKERVFRGDPGKVAGEGNMYTDQMTTTKEWKDSEGQEHRSMETYSTFRPGVVSDGQLHLGEVATTVRRTMPDGSTQTVQQVQEVVPGAPEGTLQTTATVIEISRTGDKGETYRETTTESPASNGAMKPVWVSDSRGSKKIP